MNNMGLIINDENNLPNKQVIIDDLLRQIDEIIKKITEDLPKIGIKMEKEAKEIERRVKQLQGVVSSDPQVLASKLRYLNHIWSSIPTIIEKGNVHKLYSGSNRQLEFRRYLESLKVKYGENFILYMTNEEENKYVSLYCRVFNSIDIEVKQTLNYSRNLLKKEINPKSMIK